MSKKANEPKGVRGPRGPQHDPSNTRPSNTRPSNVRPSNVRASNAGATNSAKPRAGASDGRTSLERASLPLLSRLASIPRWLVVVLMAVLLFLGLVLTGGLAWLGTIFLLIVAAFLGWLLALAWPVLPMGSRIMRVVVVGALVGIAALKAMGRF